MERNEFDVSIFVINENKEYVFIDEYDFELDGKDMFLYLTNEKLNTDFGNDNSIIIYPKWREIIEVLFYQKIVKLIPKSTNMTDIGIGSIWQKEYNFIQKDFNIDKNDGYTICKNIRDNIKNNTTTYYKKDINEYLISQIPAIMIAYYTIVEFDKKYIHGYLPSIVQLYTLSKNSRMVNAALYKLGYGKNEKFVVEIGGKMLHKWWTCNEFSDNQAFVLFNGICDLCDKNDTTLYAYRPLILPLYKIDQ